MKRRLSALILLLLALLPGCEFAAPPDQTAHTPAAGTLEVHFIDVGQADSALILCGGESMLIDGGNVDDASLVVSYLDEQGVETLDYVVCTHAHEEAGTVFSPVTEYDSAAFQNFVSYTQAQGLALTVPQAGDSFSLGEAQVTILGPLAEYEETNNTSLVLRVDFDETAFLFTGDMERIAEADLLEYSAGELWATVLKVGHHGSSTSSSYPFLREVLPTYAVISCGTGNSYGHPHEEVLSRLSDAGTTVYRTDLLGTVVAVSDGKEISFTTEKNVSPTAGRGESAEAVYIGNRNSSVFHLERCPNLPKEENRVYFSARQDALDAGYAPCGN